MKKEKNNNYTDEDKECPHCGGEIRGHYVVNGAMYWCENCGSNNRKTPPNISIKFGKTTKKNNS